MVLLEDIYDFLPKYPNISENKNTIFNPYNDNFYQNIFRKKEFYDEKLDKTEDFPDEVGGLLKHQKIIARFFSSHTHYDQLLLVHEMGTGKSCSAIGAIEEVKNTGGFRKVLYLAKGEALINNFMNELIFKCTDGRYIPENYDKLNKLEQTHRKKKMVKDYYNFNTFETFAKYIQKTKDSNLREDYNNTIIVIDEVHNLRIQEKVGGLNLYEQFLRFLHVIEGCKILLMSGTPMKDNVKEIASVMNLILPFENGKPSLPIGDEFIKDYFNKEGKDLYKVKKSKIPELKKYMKGRMSYLRSMKSNIDIVYEGSKLGTLKYFNVVKDNMSSFQSKSYKEAFKLDTEGDKEGIYSNSRQASLFVFPDNSFGKEGFDEYVKTNKTGRTFVDDAGKKKKIMSFSLKNELLKELQADTDEEKLENLSKFSSKYADSIRNILEARDTGKCVFVYNEFVTGGGLILFGLLLEFFGFAKASGKEKDKDFKPRYASLTNVTSTDTQIRDIVSRFNNKDNVNGKVINVIMGSRKISEGFSFQNIQLEEILTPWFNYSETAQAIARGIRLGSHRMLEEKGEDVSVQIFQRVSIPKNKDISIDLKMYEISENKDISIKNVERIIKESAFDCALTYNRNRIEGKDGQRECEYMDCIYNCDDISTSEISKKLKDDQLDLSTYQLYYNQDRLANITKQIIEIFRITFSIDLVSLKKFLDDYTDFEIITSLRRIINNSIVILNMYGFPSYLKEDKDIYFLIENLSLKGKFSSDYYTEFPHINLDNSFYNIITPIYYDFLPTIVNKLFSSTDLDEIRKLMSKLPTEIHEYIIEQSLLANKKKLGKNKQNREKILEYFAGFYQQIDNTWVSSYLYDEEEVLRCLSDNEWEECDKDIRDKYMKTLEQDLVNLENNPYGYYGQINPETDLFCIRDVSGEKKEKKNQRSRGQNCTSYTLSNLYDIAINKLKMPLPDEKVVKVYLDNKIKKKSREYKLKEMPSLKDKNALWDIIQKTKNIKDMFKDKGKLTTNDMVRILYWGTMQKEVICVQIRNWFKINNLLDIDKGCGDTKKKKL
jgi:superfamily II DNA or RNA helicase